MNWLNRTLTRKFTLLLIGFLALQAIQLGTGIFGIMRLGEEGAFINEAGKQRMRTLLLAHLANRILATGEVQSHPRRKFDDTIAEYEAYFARVDSFLGLKDRFDETVDSIEKGRLPDLVTQARANWEQELKPLLGQIDPARPQAARAALARYDILMPAQIERLDRIATLFVQNVRADTRRLAVFQAVVLGFSLLLGIIGLVMARYIVTRPLRGLIRGTKAIAAGAFDQRVAVKSRDELGELATAFNRMAGAISGKTSRLDAFSQVAVAITSSLSLEDILQDIMRHGAEFTGSKAACIAFYEQQSGRFREWVTYGLSDHFIRNIAFNPGGLADEAFTTTACILSNDRPETRYKLSKLARDEGIKSFICLPLTSRTGRLGVIYVYRTDRDTFYPDEIELLRTFSSLAAGAIENARLYRRTEGQARTDALTGLYNRREFDERLEAEFRRAQRYNKHFALLFLDIDHFKRANDTYGHEAGDAVLKTLADILTNQLRGVDVVVRYGGEEFVAVLPEIGGGTAKGMAERIRRAVAGTPFRLPNGQEIAVTVSIGVSSYPDCATNPQEVVARADQAMYIAKQAGRNRVVFYSEMLKARIERDPNLIVELLTQSLDNVIPVVTAISSKTPFFHLHMDQVAHAAAMLAHALNLSRNDREALRLASLLHDVGLVTTPDAVLAKTGALTPEDWELIKRHPAAGAGFLERVPALQHFAPLVRHHHERYDGEGYPDGLTGEATPYLARVLAVADGYATMSSDWLGRKALTPDQAKAELLAGAGAQFDPKIVDAMLQSLESADAA